MNDRVHNLFSVSHPLPTSEIDYVAEPRQEYLGSRVPIAPCFPFNSFRFANSMVFSVTTRQPPLSAHISSDGTSNQAQIRQFNPRHYFPTSALHGDTRRGGIFKRPDNEILIFSHQRAAIQLLNPVQNSHLVLLLQAEMHQRTRRNVPKEPDETPGRKNNGSALPTRTQMMYLKSRLDLQRSTSNFSGMHPLF